MGKALLDLSGQTALVTGASGNIGSAIARSLAGAGAQVVLHCKKDSERLVPLSKELGASLIVACDVSCEAEVISMVDILKQHSIMPNLLVNNAGVQTLGSVASTDETVWKHINNVNLGGVYALTKHISNALIAKGCAGSFVNIASIEGLDPAVNHSHYAASKAALLSYTRASAAELGAHNIRVNAIAPGLIARDGIETDWPDGVEKWRNNAPLKRLGLPEDVANATLFLLSSAAVWISGNTLIVDGGMSVKNRW